MAITTTDLLVWIDLEMTGLNPDLHVILEIASIITDSQLNIIAEGPDIVIHYPEEALRSMDTWSREQHSNSGLLQKVMASEIDCHEAERMTLQFISTHCKMGRSPLCGNSVWQDRRFLVKHMPLLNRYLHYRNIDVSTLKELVRRWYPDLPPFEKQKQHLALSDIKESIKELKYYREHVFRH